MQNLIHLESGKPLVSSLTIAKEFGRQHGTVLRSLRKLINNKTISECNFAFSNYPGRRRDEVCIDLDERGFLIAMPFIGGRKAEEGQVRLVGEPEFGLSAGKIEE